jgi:hypothetical protein
LPPPLDATVHIVFPSATPLSTEENCTVPPAGTLDTEGLMKNPGVAPIVTTAVFEVTVPMVLLVVLVVLVVVVLVCCATAVIFTCPLFVEGTTAGAV